MYFFNSVLLLKVIPLSWKTTSSLDCNIRQRPPSERQQVAQAPQHTREPWSSSNEDWWYLHGRKTKAGLFIL